jgi:hypothetical protein
MENEIDWGENWKEKDKQDITYRDHDNSVTTSVPVPAFLIAEIAPV